MLHLILGSCGSGKSTQLMNDIGKAVAAGKRAAVLFPEQFSFDGEKKLYQLLGAKVFNQVETYSFMTLSHEILTQAGSTRGGNYATEQEKLVYLWQAAKECAERKELEVLGKRAVSGEFIISLSSLITKLRKAAVTGEQLVETAGRLPDRLAHKVSDLGKLLIAYDRILRTHDRSDSLVDLTEAAQIAAKNDFFRERCFFIDEFDSFTGDQYRMLETMLARCPELTAAIRADDPAQPPTGIFLGGNRTRFEFCRIAEMQGREVTTEYLHEYRRSPHRDLAAAVKQVFRRHAQTVSYEGHLHLMQASDPEEEVSFLCAQICELLSQDNTLRCRDIAVAVKEPEIYLSRLKRAMIRYGLPFDSMETRPLLHTELVRYVLTVLELIAGNHWDTDAILRYVKSPFSGYSQSLGAMLEHFCETWGIAKDDWEKTFLPEDDESVELTQQFGGKALEALRSRLMKELKSLRRACKGKDVRTVCGAVFRHLAGKRKAYSDALRDMNELQQKDFTTVWNLLCDCLDTLVSAGGTTVVPLRELYEQMLLLLQASSFSVPPQTLDSIHIADAQTSRLNAPKILFVPGVLEGVLPGDIALSGLFSQQELETLESEQISISRLLPELHSDELMIVVKLLSAPSEQLWLTYPAQDADGNACVPSPVLDELCGMFADAISGRTSDLPLSFFVRTERSAYDIYIRRMHEQTPEVAALRQLLSEIPEYAAKLDLLSRKPEAPSVSPEIMRGLLGEQLILSPSGIETFHQCAFAYFCRYVLNLYIPERVTFSYQNVGNFTHFCLEQILREMPLEDFLSLDRQGLAKLIAGCSEQFSKAHFSDAILRSGRFQMNYRSVGSGLMELLQRMQEMLRQEGFRPQAYEVGIEPDPKVGEFPALSLDGGTILCRGKIDRVDLCRDGNLNLLCVVDYKTGDKSVVPEHIGYGLDMQMLLYLFALSQSEAFDSAKPAGVLYLPVGQLKRDSYEKRTRQTRTREEILGDYYLSRGLLTQETAAHMESRVREQAVPVLLHQEKDTLFTVTEAQMAHLQAFVEQKVIEMGGKLRAGRIAPQPCRLPKSDPCAYCKFRDLCGKADAADPPKLTKEEKTAVLYEVFGSAQKEEPHA